MRAMLLLHLRILWTLLYRTWDRSCNFAHLKLPYISVFLPEFPTCAFPAAHHRWRFVPCYFVKTCDCPRVRVNHRKCPVQWTKELSSTTWPKKIVCRGCCRLLGCWEFSHIARNKGKSISSWWVGFRRSTTVQATTSWSVATFPSFQRLDDAARNRIQSYGGRVDDLSPGAAATGTYKCTLFYLARLARLGCSACLEVFFCVCWSALTTMSSLIGAWALLWMFSLFSKCPYLLPRWLQ